MATDSKRPQDLVMSEAQRVPPPDTSGDRAYQKQEAPISPEIMEELRELADHVGGVDRLREMVDVLAGMRH